jgi:large subunit ribosomal protein L10
MNQVFSDAGAVVVAHYSGLSVAEMTAFRAKMRDAGAGVKVAKNRLAKLALKGTEAETIADLLKGPTVIAFSKDPVAAPKVATDFARTNDKLVILGGSLGRTSLNPEGIKALASLPSLDELRGKLVGLISSPATRVAQVLAAPAAQVARVVGAYANKSEAA